MENHLVLIGLHRVEIIVCLEGFIYFEMTLNKTICGNIY